MVFSIANRALVFSDNAHLRFGILIMSIAVGWPWRTSECFMSSSESY